MNNDKPKGQICCPDCFIDSMGGYQKYCKNPNCPCHTPPQEEPWDELVRDLCSVVPKSKSEVRQRLTNLLEADRKERGLRVGNIIKELRDKGLYDVDLYAHFYRIIKGY